MKPPDKMGVNDGGPQHPRGYPTKLKQANNTGNRESELVETAVAFLFFGAVAVVAVGCEELRRAGKKIYGKKMKQQTGNPHFFALNLFASKTAIGAW